MPDLAITNVSWSPADIIPGQEIIFSIDIENIGAVDAGVSRLVYYTDETIAGYNDIDSIKAGEKITPTFTWSASEGYHTVSIAADSRGQIAEIDENNNTMTVSIPPPDLAVQAISFSPEVYRTGDMVTITAHITNLKGSDTPDSIATGYIDDFSIGTQEVPPLATGEGYDFSFEWTAQADAHTFKIAADTGNTVMETDETNNEAQAVSSTTMPDLAVDGIGWQIYSHLNSTEVTLKVFLANTGDVESGVFSLKYSFDTGPETTQEVASIAADGTAELVFTTILSTGEHTCNIILDINEEIDEIDESNNQYSFTFSTNAPDLAIRSINWGPITANIGDDVTISVKVENLGLTKAVNINVSLTIDGTEAGQIDVPEIDASSIITLDFPWTAIEGEHAIDVFVDAAQSVTERDETNNGRERTITFIKQAAPAKTVPLINPAATTDGGLLETYWWALLVIGGLLGLTMIFSTVRNMRRS
jgi:subtilase family serine protease